MYLHEDYELFEEIIYNTADTFKLPVAIIEKDYYVTVFLKEIIRKQPDIVFKGGTSLSKCYKLIDRFSEDIDLSIAGDTKPGESKRKKLKEDIVSTIEDFGFVLSEPESIRSRRDFNKYIIDYPSCFGASFLKQHLIIETAIFFRSYPTKTMFADCFIYNYLSDSGHLDIIAKYGLEPFKVEVQAAERTFVDKLFAMCDYYLSGEIRGQSRHIYDLYKLLNEVVINDDLRNLVKIVREERAAHKTCLSAQESVNINLLLSEIVENKLYKEDYENVTLSLLFKSVEYEEAITVIDKVIRENLF
ncbi:MAG: nucleotidyl transferase AbiEii/AbiGii toxin family protein [Clostridia bacterium]|nr:nucleotidyl transferase AbiEii/AbiGii toxin family protein [Clostridia bacterium]